MWKVLMDLGTIDTDLIEMEEHRMGCTTIYHSLKDLMRDMQRHFLTDMVTINMAMTRLDLIEKGIGNIAHII